MMRENLLGGPPETFLPASPEASAALAAAADPAEVAARFPSYCAAWAALAERALAAGDPVSAYAFARTGYHRGLDQLRRAGWHGHGPIPWEHEPNQGFLRALAHARRGRGRDRRGRRGGPVRGVPGRQQPRRGGRAGILNTLVAALVQVADGPLPVTSECKSPCRACLQYRNDAGRGFRSVTGGPVTCPPS